ncbi:hydrogenase nickel incorporation protein [Corynebacterium atrinae]|uniref:hydrogenase maturation nickel metallochaperone HypA/HybF n=1 Tax=Corynebacterium atrinae TaxID=1336740 RepID=UPI0025B2FFF4|nr:hydrogenase maturation nickel metallochaperone HypA [Corynebacterium atrinae]WJY62670.1 hydrogenase nickel incorporation protein [Corynebacterium atrinae]
MHELSLLAGVVGAVEEVAGDKPVSSVGLRVGARSGVMVDALEAAWPVAIVGTRCHAASLEIEAIPATVWCPTCQNEQVIDEFFALVCPVCETPTADLRQGREFTISWVDVGTND